MEEKKIKKGNALTSIRTRIVAMAVGCIILALVVAYISIVPGAKNSLTDSSENNMVSLAKSYIKILNNNISAINETVSYMSSSSDIYNCLMQGGETYLVEAEFNEYLRDNSSYTEVSVYNKNGEFVTSSGAKDGRVDAPYYVNAVLSTGLPAQSDIITEGVDKPSVICAIPLDNSGSIFGVICVTVPAKVITADLGEINIQDIESSFAYLVSPQGYIIYHPEDEYIGKIIGNETIRGFLSQGNVASAIIDFNFDGSDKIAGLATSAANNWMLVIQANKAELLSPINRLTIIALIILAVTMAVLAAVVFLISAGITRPIKVLTRSINNIAELDFRDDKKVHELGGRLDETGEMSRAIDHMQSHIKEIIGMINDASLKIAGSSDTLNGIATSLNDCASDNSAVSEELAAGMEQTSGMTTSIYNEVEYIKQKTEAISKRSQETIELSKGIVARATDAKNTTGKASDNTKSLYHEVSREARTAIEQSRAVNKINDLTQDIMNIADQTSLLAINASIEAARSGEYGKGFAVVANEISHLAAQSSDTVSDIVEIVREVTSAVNSIEKCLDKTLSFLESSVMRDYDEFIQISGEYNSDAESFSDTIKGICGNIDELQNATGQIAEAISKINSTISESTNGITGIAQRATDVVTLSSDTYDKVQDNVNMANMLKEIVDKFTLE